MQGQGMFTEIGQVYVATADDKELNIKDYGNV